MKTTRLFLLAAALVFGMVSMTGAQTTYTLNPLSTFGTRGDGSIQPGDVIGINPQSGNTVAISAQFTGGVAYGIQPGDAAGSTNGFNMRGIAADPISGNLVFVDTHSGSGGSGVMTTNAAIYILDPNSGQIIGALNTNGMVTGSYTHVVPGVASDGAVYICNQTTASTNVAFKIYRWATADTNSVDFNLPPSVSYSNTLSPNDRLGQTMDVRGAGTNTQIIVGSSSANGTGTNVYLFDTTDGTNFTPHRIFFPGITNAMFNDGIAFGQGNTFFAKQVGQPLLFLSYDPVTFAGSIISQFSASSASGNDPLLNLAGITVDNVNHLLGAVEEISGTANGGRGKVWLFDIPDPTNQAPAILTSRTYTPNFIKATATMGYLCFSSGKLYANVVNNGLLASTVDAISMPLPTFTLPPDFEGGPLKVTDLPSTTRVAVNQNAHFEVFATPDVTNYQWYSNNVLIAGATTYFFDLLNVQTNLSGTVYKVIASNAAGSVESVHSTLVVVSAANFFHPVALWSLVSSGGLPANATNYMTAGGAGTPNERTIAYNPISHQLIVVRGPGANSIANVRIFAVDPDTGAFEYALNTNGIEGSTTLALVGCGVADDGAFYACSVAANTTFKVYRWADTDSNTAPQLIFGTNSSAANANPAADLSSTIYRWGDDMAVHGAGVNTEIIMDSQNNTTFAGILRPTDATMTNWSQTGYLFQNTSGSYGFQAYGTGIGRSIQFGPNMDGPIGPDLPTFWQKRYFASGAPLSIMGYNAGGGVAGLDKAATTLPIYTNGPLGINFTLNLAAAISFSGAPSANVANQPDLLVLYDMTDPAQPVFLSQQTLPGAFTGGGQMANNNAIAQIVFGSNPSTGSNYIFALNANNGIESYVLQGGVTPAPQVLTQPVNLRMLQNSTASLYVQIDQLTTVQWYKDTNSPAFTGVTGNTFTITNAQLSDAGDYFVIASNINGSVTSHVAQVSVASSANNYTLSQIWAATAGNAAFPYVTANGGANTPTERSFAYSAVSNQLLVVSLPVLTDNYNIYVVDAATGSNLYSLNTSGIVNEGASEVSGSNPLDLDAIAVADDGAVYVASLTPNASGGALGDTTKMLHVYRWADSGPATAPTLVYQGDPANQPAGVNERWGDVMAARGSGTNTQLFLNSHDGSFAGVLVPTSSSMAQFTNFWFNDSSGAGSIGRSAQFGAGNVVYEKRKGAAFFTSGYNTNNNTSSNLLTIPSSVTLGGVFYDAPLSLVAGVDFVGSTTAPKAPDAVALYDVSTPSAPLLINRYPFPANQVANANFICQTVVSGLRVYALDGNNGLTAFYINPPVNGMNLQVTPAGANVNLSWGAPVAILQGSPTLSPSTWTDLTTVGQTSSLQPAGGNHFYRLVVRR